MARLAVLAVVLAAPAAALAQPGLTPPAAPPPPGGALPFIRHDGDSFVDVRAGVANGAMPDIDETTQAIDLSAQYLVSDTVGLYGAFGVARTTFDTTEESMPGYWRDVEYRGTTPLDLEVGGLLRYHDDAGDAVTLSAGLSIPTVMNLDHLYLPGNEFFEFGEATDAVRYVNRFAVRAAVTPSLRRGPFVLAGVAGVDVVPSAADPLIADAAIAIGVEAGFGTSVTFGVGGYHRFDDLPLAQSSTLLFGLDLAQRVGPAQIWVGGRLGPSQIIEFGASLEGGVRWRL